MAVSFLTSYHHFHPHDEIPDDNSGDPLSVWVLCIYPENHFCLLRIRLLAPGCWQSSCKVSLWAA